MTEEERIQRHESHFSKIFGELDSLKTEVRNNYVRSPTFIIALISVVAILFGSFGSIATVVYTKTEKNQDRIVQMSREQGKIEERQKFLEKDQDIRIAQLIEALNQKAKPKNIP